MRVVVMGAAVLHVLVYADCVVVIREWDASVCVCTYRMAVWSQIDKPICLTISCPDRLHAILAVGSVYDHSTLAVSLLILLTT